MRLNFLVSVRRKEQISPQRVLRRDFGTKDGILIFNYSISLTVHLIIRVNGFLNFLDIFICSTFRTPPWTSAILEKKFVIFITTKALENSRFYSWYIIYMLFIVLQQFPLEMFYKKQNTLFTRYTNFFVMTVTNIGRDKGSWIIWLHKNYKMILRTLIKVDVHYIIFTKNKPILSVGDSLK